MSDNALQQAADFLGRSHGHSAGTWMIDGNTSDETKRAIIKGYDEGDPMIMDMQPSPLSTVTDVLDQIMTIADVDELNDPDEMVSSDLLDRYETTYSQAFWDEVIRSAKATLSDDNDEEQGR